MLQKYREVWIPGENSSTAFMTLRDPIFTTLIKQKERKYSLPHSFQKNCTSFFPFTLVCIAKLQLWLYSNCNNYGCKRISIIAPFFSHCCAFLVGCCLGNEIFQVVWLWCVDKIRFYLVLDLGKVGKVHFWTTLFFHLFNVYTVCIEHDV